MRNPRILILVIAVAIIVIAALAIGLLLRGAPELSRVELSQALCQEVAPGEDCLRFPIVTGLNLSNESFDLPDDFAGDPVFVVMPFDDGQQITAETWLPLARDLAETRPDFAYYNIPVFPDIDAGVRLIIRAGLNIAITDAALRDLTITLFLEDRDLFLDALAIPDVDAVEALLLSGDGEVLWRGRGPYDADQGASLRAVMMQLDAVGD